MSRKYHFILHIGTEKTGTSSLQYLLSVNNELLSAQGFYYFSSKGRQEARSLASYALEVGASDDFLKAEGIEEPEQFERFCVEVSNHFRMVMDSLPKNVHTVIISSEHFHSRLRSVNSINRLKQLLEDYAESYTVICYLRRQVDLAASYYSTGLKNGSVLSLREFVAKTCNPDNHYYNYLKLLGLWQKVFGEDTLVVRKFVAGMGSQESVVSDFLQQINFPTKIEEVNLRRNTSLTPFGQRLLRGLNKVLLQQELASDQKVQLKNIKEKVVQAFGGKGETLGLEMAARIQASFDKSNEQVRQQFFPESAVLFEPLAPEIVVQKPLVLSVEQVDIAASLLEQVHRLSSRAMAAFDPLVADLRDMAVSYEKQDLLHAKKLMAIAGSIRPDGPLIKAKLELYDERLSNPVYRIKQFLSKNMKWPL